MRLATNAEHMMSGTTATERVGRSNPWIAAGLSAVVPGAGHWYLRRYRSALLWFAPVVGAIAFGVITSPDPRSVVIAALSPTTLWGLFGVNILAFVWRAGCAIDAYRRAGGFDERWATPFAAVGGIALALVIAVPHIAVGDLTYNAIRLVDIAFVDVGEVPTQPVIPIGTDADLVPDPVVTTYDVVSTTTKRFRGRIHEPGIGDPDAVAAWEGAHTVGGGAPSPFLPFTERVGTDRITILFAGGDAGPGRGGLRTDTMILATFDPETGKAALFGFPRNLGSTPLPPNWDNPFLDLELRILARVAPPTTTVPPDVSTTIGTPSPTVPFEGCDCFPEQLNALYAFTRRWTGSYPNDVDPGMAALRDVLSHVSGLKIDYYALVDMAAFVDLVEAIGGVDVYVQDPLKSEVSPPREGEPWASVDVDVGWHHLDGREALAYVRARKGSTDYVRMQRQRCMLRAIAAKSSPVTILRSFGGIVDALDGTLVTDIPVSFAPDLMSMAADLDFDDVATFGFRPGYYAPEWDPIGHAIPDVDRIRG
ncbi:MAG: LCP family protein, partial [Acidimicrobiia bacterium]|nr:LCP family protein [Acidimicrobiia bacterium]